MEGGAAGAGEYLAIFLSWQPPVASNVFENSLIVIGCGIVHPKSGHTMGFKEL